MQQRVEILKMLYRDNEILILDEPTAVLTPQEIDELMEIMRSFAAEGKSILFITHKLNEIMAVADRCTVLRLSLIHILFGQAQRLQFEDLFSGDLADGGLVDEMCIRDRPEPLRPDVPPFFPHDPARIPHALRQARAGLTGRNAAPRAKVSQEGCPMYQAAERIYEAFLRKNIKCKLRENGGMSLVETAFSGRNFALSLIHI